MISKSMLYNDLSILLQFIKCFGFHGATFAVDSVAFDVAAVADDTPCVTAGNVAYSHEDKIFGSEFFGGDVGGFKGVECEDGVDETVGFAGVENDTVNVGDFESAGVPALVFLSCGAELINAVLDDFHAAEIFFALTDGRNGDCEKVEYDNGQCEVA